MLDQKKPPYLLKRPRSTQGGSRTLTHIVHYDLNVARLPIPALGYEL